MATRATLDRNNGAFGVKTRRRTVSQALVEYLAAQYSERDGRIARVIPGLYGIFGHGNAVGLGQAVEEFEGDFPHWQGKNEQSMVHAAIGYAKATRRRSTFACTTSVGAGALNMVTGAGTATANRLPVLLLPADTFVNRRPHPVLQQIEHPMYADVSANDAFRSVSRYWDRIVSPEQLLYSLPEAIRVLLDPAETGAVTIGLPQDTQGEAFDFPVSFFEPHVWSMSRRPAAADELAAALELLRNAERPLVIAGGGVRYSEAEEQ
ncbi:MAG: 3D-(3,5/4)-trihydroxycyclohexane-1,2-dione acylhydrolase (decyclizing), partial [Actinobacteria bacterium]|nr:3D-(3,5/4)-trihydroxycyclohexane-1,2-dione acylhydrolase (decyclizing) [Actinomycetota bacterium]